MDRKSFQTQAIAFVLHVDRLGVAAAKINRDNFIAPLGARIKKGQRHTRTLLATEMPLDSPTNRAGAFSPAVAQSNTVVPLLENCPAKTSFSYPLSEHIISLCDIDGF